VAVSQGPLGVRHYPPGVRLALLPFSEEPLRHFMFLERPEGMDLEDAAGLDAVADASPLMSEEEIVPRLQDFATVGHLYRSIEAGFRHLVDKLGENGLFVGPPQAQITQANFSWPQLVPVRPGEGEAGGPLISATRLSGAVEPLSAIAATLNSHAERLRSAATSQG
jgi:hypothetical protein